ncbi:MAG: S-formylglutathione hydrolase [Gammaproteobacteria bacterium]|nr:S-formylglutathione hydrolase [Gammaproteobacteria bacterium]
MRIVAESRCHEGRQLTVEHPSDACRCPMRFALFLPPGLADGGKAPALYFLSGLTCTEENFTVKAGAQRFAAQAGLALVVPDTSPRNTGIPGEDDEDFLGSGAGFYVNATQAPWSAHYRMYDYVSRELPQFVESSFPIDPARRGICGHSMGGHGALVIALRNPGRYRSVSALAPISNPSSSPWGRAAFSAYLGDESPAWREYDASALVQKATLDLEIRIDLGSADPFREEELMVEQFLAACRESGQRVSFHLRGGYDHGYFFVGSFIEDHIRHHAAALRNGDASAGG